MIGFGQSSPRVDQIHPDSARNQPKSSQIRPNAGEFDRIWLEFCQLLAEFGQHWETSTKFRPSSANICPDIDRLWPGFDQTWLELCQAWCWPLSTEYGRFRPSPSGFWLNLAYGLPVVARIRQKLERFRPTSAQLGLDIDALSRDTVTVFSGPEISGKFANGPQDVRRIGRTRGNGRPPGRAGRVGAHPWPCAWATCKKNAPLRNARN